MTETGMMVLTEEQIQDTEEFVKSARLLRYDPPCVITAFMVNHDIDDLTETQLIEEALELAGWLREKSIH